MPDPTPADLLDELERDGPPTPQRLKRVRETVREHTGLTVPRGAAGVMPWWREHGEDVLAGLREAADRHTCDVCGESFGSAAALNGHQNAHN